MNNAQCQNRIDDLKSFMSTCLNLFESRDSMFYKDTFLQCMIVKAENEIKRLEELRYNMELDDSYDLATRRYLYE